MRRIYRVEEDKMVDGVCGGIAEYLDVDPTIVRVIWAVLALAYGTGIIAYLVCALCMPAKSQIK